MMLPVCSHEKEVSGLLHGGQWPSGCARELREHVALCRVCSDLVLVTGTLHASKKHLENTATPHSPGLVWWRAQLRRRNAAIERVSKPFFGAQIFALAVYLVLAVGLILSQARHGLRWLEWLAELPQAQAFHLQVLLPLTGPAARLDWSRASVFPAAALLALFSGVIVYFASDKH